jgi:hypothetical protein
MKMADHYIVTGVVIKWDVGDDGNAKYIDNKPVDGVFTDTQDDKIKEKLSAEWLDGVPDKDLREELSKMKKGLRTVAITSKTLVQPPEIDEETKAAKALEMENIKSVKLSSDIAAGVGKAISVELKKGGKP